MPENGTRFDEVLQLHGDALWRLTAGYAFQPADREDLYQEVLLAIWRALPRFRGESSIRTFIYRIAHNRGMTFRGRTAARTRREGEVPPDLRDPSPGVDATLDERWERQQLLEAVLKLPPSLSRTVILSLEGLSYTEIAAVLDITENNVGVRLHRGRAMLERMLMRGNER